jgi:subtilisin family serine protease
MARRGARRSARRVGPTGQETKEGYVSARVEAPAAPDYVVVELRYESPVAYTPTGFRAPEAAAPQADSLNTVLARYDIARVRSQFGLKPQDIRSRIDVAAALPPEPSPERFADRVDARFFQSNFAQVVPKRSQDAPKIARELNRRKPVWKAFVAPRPVPAMPEGAAVGSRLFEPAQGYLHAPPTGIGAVEVWGLAGAKGQGVTICDIEGNWNRTHQDLPTGIQLIGGTVIQDLGWRNHGTAVLGEMVSRPDGMGAVGISHGATAVVHSAVINNVFNTAGAINNAANQLGAGDVILIELQGTGPNGKFVAMQFWSDVFTAIKAATAKGITVVEAAGNGNENFELAMFANTGLQKDSGAIVVGAGVPPTNHFDFDNSYDPIGVPRSRIWFSNYGSIVNVQAWGWHVTTLGYGDAQGGQTQKTWYTLRFSGTSSASPIVTGAVACLQGRAKAKNGAPLAPAAVRQILMDTGTPQEPGPGVPLTQHIGPLPNLPLAMKQV